MKLIALWASLFLTTTMLGQDSLANRTALLAFSAHYGFYAPFADMKDRFGNNFYLGIGTDFINKRKYFLGIEGGILFGNHVKTDPLSILRNELGEIIGLVDGVGVLANVTYRERGLYLGAKIGKLIPLAKSNQESYLKVSFGLGLLQHKIRLQDDDSSLPAIANDLSKGYDRLTNGLSLQQFIGYQMLSANRRINLYIGMEFYEAFTNGRRSYDVNLRGPDDEKRNDVLIGLKAGLIIPLYFEDKDAEIYY